MRRRPSTSARAGFTLIEALMMMTVLAIGLGGMASVLGYTTALVRVDQQTTVAATAAGERVEALQTLDFDTLYRRFNSDPSDDPGIAGSAPGSGFAVPGLEPVAGDPDGLVGEILFPDQDAGGGDMVLLESIDEPLFGTPRDLNADGVIDGDDRTDDYVLLPVVIRLTWQSGGGRQDFEFATLLIAGG